MRSRWQTYSKPGADADVVSAEVLEVVQEMIEDHHDDGDTTEGINLPVPANSNRRTSAEVETRFDSHHPMFAFKPLASGRCCRCPGTPTANKKAYNMTQ
jgi:hypothetical protein